jgi:hypothetical protein
VMNLPVTTLRAMHVCRGSNGKFLLRRSCLWHHGNVSDEQRPTGHIFTET